MYIYTYVSLDFPLLNNISVAVFFRMFAMPCHLTAGTVAKGPAKTGAIEFWVSCWLQMGRENG